MLALYMFKSHTSFTVLAYMSCIFICRQASTFDFAVSNSMQTQQSACKFSADDYWQMCGSAEFIT